MRPDCGIPAVVMTIRAKPRWISLMVSVGLGGWGPGDPAAGEPTHRQNSLAHPRVKPRGLPGTGRQGMIHLRTAPAIGTRKALGPPLLASRPAHQRGINEDR